MGTLGLRGLTSSLRSRPDAQKRTGAITPKAALEKNSVFERARVEGTGCRVWKKSLGTVGVVFKELRRQLGIY